MRLVYAQRNENHCLHRTDAMTEHPEFQYLRLLQSILDHGHKRDDRTGTGTIGLFGHQMRFDLTQGFPLLTTKKVHFKSIAIELLWFLKGETNIKFLKDNGVKIWDEWADPDGELGPVYGKQWRSWAAPDGRLIDQMSRLVDEIKTNPMSRRHIVTAWNPADLDAMALPACHCFFQFYVSGNRLSCQLYQRSGDAFLGVPFNIASYALLTHMVANATGLEVGDFIHSFGDVHIYLNHIDQVRTQLERTPLPFPQLRLKAKADLFSYEYQDFALDNYQSHSVLKAPVAV